MKSHQTPSNKQAARLRRERRNERTARAQAARESRKSRRSRRVYAEVGGDENEQPRSSKAGCVLWLLIILIGAGFYVYKNKDRWDFDNFLTPAKVHKKHIPDPVNYEHLKAQLATDRQALETRFINANTAAEQQAVLDEASALLEDMMPKMMRCWLGHPWDFNGTATVPGEGKIACGYYVSVIMRDAGFKVERIKLAQQPSQRIIKTFLPIKKDKWITSGFPYDEYVQKVKASYPGINIVGLDNHVAFVVVKNDEMRFIHSSGNQDTKQVVDEAKPDAHALKFSSYRVIGNITRNRQLLQKWVLGDPFPTAR